MTRGAYSPGSRTALLSFALLACTCAPAEPEPVEIPAIDSLPADIAFDPPRGPPYDPDDPFFGFDLDRTPEAATEQRTLALRLRNDGSEDVLVFADAGAGEVRIDSVAAGAWTRVDLLTRASVVALRSISLTGRVVRRVEITVGADTVRDVVISAAGSPEGVDRSPHTTGWRTASREAM